MATTTVPWAQEFACYGNRVGAIALGMVETLMTAGMNQTALEAFVQQIPTAVKGGRALVDDHLGQLDQVGIRETQLLMRSATSRGWPGCTCFVEEHRRVQRDRALTG